MTDYAGFSEDPMARIGQLANDLNDRYPTGFPVIKELVQNADDAGASHLVFGLVPGLENAHHPLLKGPGLFVANNGRFERKHADGIRLFGLSGKITERASVGKFGLGMKSVFHFCEAFFFSADIEDEGLRSEVLNPWSIRKDLQTIYRPIHQDWDSLVTMDAAQLREAVAPAVGGLPILYGIQPFILWLPLRRRAHLRRKDGSETGKIVPEYHGDADRPLPFLFEPKFIDQLSSLVPLLRNLGQLELFSLPESSEPVFSVAVSADAARLRYPDESPNGVVKGAVTVRRAGRDESRIAYVGQEVLDGMPQLRALKDLSNWPRNNAYDKETYESIEVPDKAEAHRAVILSSSESEPGGGTLTLRWAVFLPLDEGLASETVDCGGDANFCCTLHGYFFVDAGRRAIHGWDEMGQNPNAQPADSEDEVRIAWNAQLAQEGTLRLLLQVFHDHVRETPPSARVALGHRLALGLTKTKLWDRFHSDIAGESRLVLVLTRQGQEWRLVPPNHDLLPFPSPPKAAHSRPWEVFPVLKDLGSTLVLVQEGAPHLVSGEKPVLSDARLQQLVRSVPIERVFKSRAELDYLSDTLESAPSWARQSWDVQASLVQFMRSGLREHSLSGLRANAAWIRRLVSVIPATRRLRLPEGLSEQLQGDLLSCNVEPLVLPVTLAPDGGAELSALALDDAEKLLGIVGAWVQRQDSTAGSRSEDVALRFAEGLIKKVDIQHRDQLLGRLADAVILQAYDGVAGRWTGVSPATIRSVRDHGLLFRRVQGPIDQQGRGLALELQKTLMSGRVLVISGDTANLLVIPDGEIQGCDERGCLQALGQQPRNLAEPEKRKALLGRLSDPGDDEAAVRGLRFLLHGKDAHFYDQQMPLWVRNAEHSAAWERLWSQLNEGWNLVEPEMVRPLTMGAWETVGIHFIDPTTLLAEVRERGADRIDPTAFTANECAEILYAVSDEAVWRTLPLHETVEGQRRVALGEFSYLATALVAPQELGEKVEVIRRSSDSRVLVQQVRWLPEFTPLVRLRLLLKTETPSHFAAHILDDLYEVHKELDPDLESSVRTCAWVPDRDGNAVAPEDVIDIEDESGEVVRLVEQAPPGTYSLVSLLSDVMPNHRGFARVRRGFFAHGREALQNLGLLIAEQPRLCLGDVSIEDGEFQPLVESFRELPDHVGLPGWPLLGRLADTYGLSDVERHVLPEVVRAIENELDTIVSALKWIAGRGRPDRVHRTAFEVYLRRFAKLPEAENRLSELRLIDSGGDWRPAAELCCGARDIARRFVLCDSQTEILRGQIQTVRSRQETDFIDESSKEMSRGQALANTLREFFRDWRDRVPDPLIGCFVYLCGSHEAVKSLAESYLVTSVHSLDWLINEIPWEIEDGITFGIEDYLYGMSLSEALDTVPFSAVVRDSDRVIVRSILGKSLEVKKTSSPSSFLTVAWNVDEVAMQLASIDVTAESETRLRGLLRNSAEQLLECWSMRDARDLSDLWEKLDSNDQFDVELARSLILESLPTLLRQVKLQRNDALNGALKAYEEARVRVVEFRGHAREADYEAERRQALAQIQDLIEGDSDVQHTLLEAVRNKMRRYQYRIESIPFELFQNADDAVWELSRIEEYRQSMSASGTSAVAEGLGDELLRFHVRNDDSGITFLHWGRPVNAIGDPFPGRDYGHHQDLEKMLILAASDKDEDVTGKHGLGFKSVFLCCDRPHLVSGRLSVEILGGMLPARLADDRRLRDLLEHHGAGTHRPGTAIAIATDHPHAKRMLDPFKEMAGVLCVFAKAIRRIEVSDESGSHISVSWDPSPLAFAPKICKGTVFVRGDKGEMATHDTLCLDLATGALLVGLDERGIRPLPNTIPTLWVTAPTQEDDSLGFALNGDFDVDVGRTRLATNEEGNEAVAGVLGNAFELVLKELDAGVRGNWEAVSKSLDLADRVTPYDLWRTLWTTMLGRLQNRRSAVGAVAAQFLRSGLGPVVADHRVIPNGLWGTDRRLLRVGEIRNVLRGALATEAIHVPLRSWSKFQERIAPGETLLGDVHEWVAFVDPTYGGSRARWRSVKLADIAAWLGRDEFRFDPLVAGIWGAALSPLGDKEVMADLPKEVRDDLETTLKLLRGSLFRSAANAWRPASELLDPRGEREERLRWEFAPDDRRLSSDYDERGTECLRYCRTSGFEAKSSLLAEWVLRAPSDDEKRRQAALRYLRDGGLAAEVLDRLVQSDIEGTWLGSLSPDSPYFADWDGEIVARLLVQLEPYERQIELLEGGEDEKNDRLQDVDVAETLKNIVRWWQKGHVSLLRKYEYDVYPGGVAPLLGDEDEIGDYNRSAWLKLFLIGSFHTMGLFGFAQNRGFIEFCKEKGWWNDVFTMTDPEKSPDKWMKVLDTYVDEQEGEQRFNMWMQRFPSIYWLSRDLNSHRELFLKLGLWKWNDGECYLDKITRSRISSELQRGGESAPPIHKTLGIGACFVVRELLRLGVIQSEHLHACAYVPTKGIRDLFARWGYEQFVDANADVELSKEIYAILKQHLDEHDVLFGGAYDIPLGLVAYDKGLENQLTAYKPHLADD